MTNPGAPRPRPPPPERAATLVIEVKVKPGARVSALEQAPDGQWHAQLKSPPVDGKANLELIALVARHFGCAKAAVAIKSGAGARHKRLTIKAG